MNRRAFLKASTGATIGGWMVLAGVNAANAKQDSLLQDMKAKQAGLQHYFVEHDNPDDPLRSIAASYAYLKKLRF